jgi:hypothetical protein
MKKLQLILLGIILLTSGKSISQTDTSKVVITTTIAQKITTDLIAGDFCKKKINFLELNIKELEKKVVVKDSMIFNRESKITNLNTMLLKKDEMFTMQEEISKTYLKDLRKSKRTILLYKVFAIIGATTTGYYILLK